MSEARVAIVTGGGRGIGRAFALRFARDGYRVAVADRDGASARSVADEVNAGDGTALAVEVDVADEASAARAVGAVLGAWGRIDVLVNNAALFADLERRSLLDIPVDEWDRVFAVNVRGVFVMLRAVAPAMIAQRTGSIINMSSNTFLSGRPGFLHYVASKGAVVGLTRAAARELGEHGIRVNCIMPGLTRTGVPRAVDVPGRYEELVKSQSIKRVEVPEDLVGTAAFLASDDAAFMTGQSLVVDGGNSML